MGRLCCMEPRAPAHQPQRARLVKYPGRLECNSNSTLIVNLANQQLQHAARPCSGPLASGSPVSSSLSQYDNPILAKANEGRRLDDAGRRSSYEATQASNVGVVLSECLEPKWLAQGSARPLS